MLAVVVTGHKKSGKTALLSLVAEALERKGKQVAVVKYSNHAIEHGNTDAFWFMRPGRTVVNVSPEETAVFLPDKLPLEAIAARVNADVLLLEGGDAPVFVPRIVCFREGEDADISFLPGSGTLTIIATHGETSPGLDAPHFIEMNPSAAEKIADVILKNGVVL